MRSKESTSSEVDTSAHLQQKPNIVLIDGCAQLWWASYLQNDGTMENLTDTLLQLVLS